MLEAYVRGLLARFMARELTAEQLEVELPDGWDLDEGGDRQTRRLVLRAMGYLAQHARGDWNDDMLRTAIRDLAAFATVGNRSPRGLVTSAFHGTTIWSRPPKTEQRPGADTSHEEVLV